MKILQIAGFGKYFGSGHLIRQNIISEILKELEIDTEIIKINKNKEILNLNIDKYDLIIKDSRDSNENIDKFFNEKPLITFDDYYISKIYRGYRYYWNSIPSLKNYGNIKSLKYLILKDYDNITNSDSIISNSLNKSKTHIDNNISNFQLFNLKYDIVVNFGHLDPYNCSSKIAVALNENYNLIKDLKIIFVLPDKIYKKIIDNKCNSIFSNFDLIKSGDSNYVKVILNSKIIITHFGLFLFETLKLNKYILLFSPTSYHEKLSKKYFSDFLISKNGKVLSQKLCDSIIKFTDNSKVNKTNNELKLNNEIKDIRLNDICDYDDIKKLIKNLINYINKNKLIINCPICKTKKRKIIYSEENFHLVYCKKCHTLHKSNLNFENMNSDNKEKYYIDEYRQAYGKTYFEDRENIKNLNLLRLKNIIPLLNKFEKNTISALDFGGALGFFLDDLKDQLNLIGKNLDGYIIENNSFALQFCENKGYRSFNSFNALQNRCETKYDLISFWFCLEHIEEIDKTIKESYNLLNKGGVFSLSFPSTFGPSFYLKKNRKNYINNRPKDHYYDFNPYSFKNYLKQLGFNIKKIVVPTYHYERFSNAFPLLSKLINKNFFMKFSKILYFGDIIEIYATRK